MPKKNIEITVVEVKSRDLTTKGAVAELRKEGFVPSVIYGNNENPIPVAIEQKTLIRFLEKPGFTTRLLDLDINGKKHRIIPRAVQFHPVTDIPLPKSFRVNPKSDKPLYPEPATESELNQWSAIMRND